MMKTSIFLTAFLLILVCCSEVNQKMTLHGQAQGTYYALTYFDVKGRNFRPEIDSILEAFDQSVSLWEPASVISRVNAGDSMVSLDPWFTDLFYTGLEVSKFTEGAFDMTIGPLVNAWGFGFGSRLLLDSMKVDSLREFVGFEKVSLLEGKVIRRDPRIRLDFNAIAQGYAVDLLASFLESQGIHTYIVDIGGEVFARGVKPDGTKWRVGIERPAGSPADDRQLKAVVELRDEALATSGNYRKFFEENGIRYSHTIDPATGYPVHHSLLSVSVRASDCATADAYATAFMVMGVDRSLEFLSAHPALDAYFIYTDSTGQLKTELTRGMKRMLVEEN